MGTTAPQAFFVGWAGFGQTFANSVLTEPSDNAYARRPIIYGPVDEGFVEDVSSGTIGPSTMVWNNLSFVGLYDSAVVGNLLAVLPLDRPVTVTAGGTLTTSRAFSFRLLSGEIGSATYNFSWVSGAQIGATPKGAQVVSGCNVQIHQGVLTAIGTSSSITSLSNLPSLQPPAGSGMLWNNGGVICIA